MAYYAVPGRNFFLLKLSDNLHEKIIKIENVT